MSSLPDRGLAADDLERRLRQTVAAALRALGREERDGDVALDSAGVGALIGDLESLALERAVDAPAASADSGNLERLQGRYESRLQALRDAAEAIDGLRVTTSPDTVLGLAPKELCEHSGLDRVVLGLVVDGRLTAEVVHFRADPAGAAAALSALRRAPMRLRHPLIEAELMRRRRATIVADAARNPRVHQETAQIMEWAGYVAAPVVVGGEVIGALHADTGRDGRALDVLDGDVLWTFARGLAEVYETVSLRRALRRQRDATRQFVEWLTVRAAELSDTAMQLVAEPPPPPPPPGRLEPFTPEAGGDDRAVFQDLLSRRELEVLRLIVRGESNGSIAAQLVIAEPTVKFHVVNLLRKLHVSNRAEAVARYHRLVRRRPDQAASPGPHGGAL
jgi:DNA-binding CsgD family transcriptional regulator